MMSAQIVVAVDEPNLRISLREGGFNDAVDYTQLRTWCEADGLRRLGTSQAKVKATVFKPIQVDDPRESFRNQLQLAGWNPFFKVGDRPPTQRRQLIRSLQSLLEVIDEPIMPEVDPRRQARLRSTLDYFLAEFGDDLPPREVRRLTRVSQSLKYSWVRRYVARKLGRLQAVAMGLRLDHYKEELFSQSQTLLNAYPLVQTEVSLSPDYSSQLVWETASRVLRAAKYLHLLEHLQWDIDRELRDWATLQVKPLGVNVRSDLPAVVYLVGADFRNHLPLAERLKKYGAEPVLLTIKSKFDEMSPAMQRGARRYSVVFIEDLLHDSATCVA